MHGDYPWQETEPILFTLLQFGRYKKLEIVLKSCYVFVVESVSLHSKFKYSILNTKVTRENARVKWRRTISGRFFQGFLVLSLSKRGERATGLA